jgi:N-ethylmaleimide reductase
MTEADIRAAIAELAHAATSSIEAGADGIELHGANGYLIEQFLNTASNKRTDGYGAGSVASRIRFAVEVVEACVAAIGKDRVGIRISPYGANGGMVADPETDAVYTQLARELSRIGIVYLHIVDHSSMGAPPVKPEIKAALRETFRGTLLLAGGYDRARAEADLEAKRGDLFVFGRPFLSNPNLVAKLRDNRPLTPPDMSTAFTPGDKGYLDYAVD